MRKLASHWIVVKQLRLAKITTATEEAMAALMTSRCLQPQQKAVWYTCSTSTRTQHMHKEQVLQPEEKTGSDALAAHPPKNSMKRSKSGRKESEKAYNRSHSTEQESW